MRKFIPYFVVMLLLSMPCFVLAMDSNKVGIIDMEKFQQESKRFQEMSVDLKKKFGAMEKKLQKEKADLAIIQDEFKKQSMMLSLDAKETKRQELEKKQRYYKYLYAEYTQEIKDTELEVRKKVGKAVEKIVGSLGKKGGYLTIFERRAPGLIYYDDALDITDKVVKAYDGAKQ